MYLPLYIARRIYLSEGDRRQVSRPAIRIATLGVAIGLAVMIVTVAVVFGFKHTIRDKVVGFGSHVQVENFLVHQTATPLPACINDTLMMQLRKVPGIRNVSRYSLVQGILKTDDDFLGVCFKGVGPDYDLTFLRQHLKEGTLPHFTDSTSRYPLLISQTMANQLRLHVGQRVYAYFVGQQGVRARQFTVQAIYQTDMKQFDDVLCLTDFRIPQRLNGWESDQCSGLELLVNDFDHLNEVATSVSRLVDRSIDRYGETLTSKTVYDAYPQVFSWLSLLDINVWIILGLMVCVASFTMISGLLIIILERTRMIGVLKALGSRNSTIRRTFLWFAVFIIGQGLLLGDFLGVGFILLQQHTGLIRLDPSSYYVDIAPVELNIPVVILLNLATMLISLLVLIGPTTLVSHIHPVQSMRYE